MSNRLAVKWLLLTLIFLISALLSIAAAAPQPTLLRKSCADPWLLRYDGKFYLAQTGATKILVEESETLEGLGAPSCQKTLAYDSAVDKTVTELGYKGVSGTWSPEIHHFTDDEFPGFAGWYMFLALRDSAPGDSSRVKGVVLKSLTNSPAGPYGHPVTGERFSSQPLLDKDGAAVAGWVIGQSSLVIRKGKWKGAYGMFVTEKRRGSESFHQEIVVARMKTPWQLASDFSVMTTPTQHWETIGSGPSNKKPGLIYPKVVEGATTVYGDLGDVYVIYSGSGYWSNYGLGQLTWTGGDPLQQTSWIKYDGNPVFGAADANGNHLPGVDLQGAGHASFFSDAGDKRFMVFHAYPYNSTDTEKTVDGVTLAPRQKSKSRNAYVAPYRIDYSKDNGAGKGVFTTGDFNANE